MFFVGSGIHFIFILLFFVGMPFIVGIYNRKSRKLLWSISGLLLLFFSYNHLKKTPNEIQLERENVGVYVLDIEKSSLEDSDVKEYSKSILIVRSDNTFEIKGNLPFFHKTGTWKIRDEGEFCIKKCSFDNSDVHFTLSCSSSSWTFRYRDIERGLKEDMFVFKKSPDN
jgi:hypothetical protein